jgi:hypothetical protein
MFNFTTPQISRKSAHIPTLSAGGTDDDQQIQQNSDVSESGPFVHQGKMLKAGGTDDEQQIQ